MSLKYVLSENLNPQNPTAPRKWYAVAKSSGEVSLKELSKEITQRSTVNSADTLAVLDSLTQVLTEHLNRGEIVRFGDFGSFRVTLSGEGADTEAAYNSSLIKSTKVQFRPGEDIKQMLNNLKFEKF